MKLVWGLPQSGGIPTVFKIYRETGKTVPTPSGTPLATVSSATFEYTDLAVSNYETYTYVSVASNNAGDGPPSNPATAMPNNGAPGTPQNLAATGGDRQVTLTWDPPLGGGDVFEYSVTRCELAGCTGWAPVATVQAPATSVQDTDGALVNFTTYQYRVAAVNPIGTSTEATATAMPNNGAPGTPRNLGTAAAMGSITLSWQAPETGGDVHEYRIFRSTSPTVNTAGEPLAVTGPGATGYTDTAVTDFNTYYYAIAAWNPVGQGAPTPAVEEMAGAAPGAPEMALTSGDGSVTLAWAAGAGGPVDTFRIYRAGTPGVDTSGPAYYQSTAQGTLVDSPLANGQAVFYRAVAENQKGVSPPSAELTGYPRAPNSEVPSDDPQFITVGDQTGRAVAISGDHAIIGAPLHDHSPTETDTGAVYLYERNPQGGWTRVAFLEKPGESPFVSSAQFGHAVAISGDVALVGAPGETRSDGTETLVGRVSIFRRSAEDGWVWEADLEPPKGSAQTRFGFSLATDGRKVLVGAPLTGTVNCGVASPTTGTVYPFEYVAGVWIAKAPIRPPAASCDPSAYHNMQFGFSLAMDGDFAVIGAPWEGLPDRGAAFFYQRNTESGEWEALTGSTFRLGTGFIANTGWSVALRGTWAVVGSPARENSGGFTGKLEKAGLVTFLEFVNANWVNRQSRPSPYPAANQEYGRAVSIAQNRVLSVALPPTSSANHQLFQCTLGDSTWTCGTSLVYSASFSGGPVTANVLPTMLTTYGLTVAAEGDNLLIGTPFADVPVSNNGGDFTFR